MLLIFDRPWRPDEMDKCVLLTKKVLDRLKLSHRSSAGIFSFPVGDVARKRVFVLLPRGANGVAYAKRKPEIEAAV